MDATSSGINLNHPHNSLTMQMPPASLPCRNIASNLVSVLPGAGGQRSQSIHWFLFSYQVEMEQIKYFNQCLFFLSLYFCKHSILMPIDNWASVHICIQASRPKDCSRCTSANASTTRVVCTLCHTVSAKHTLSALSTVLLNVYMPIKIHPHSYTISSIPVLLVLLSPVIDNSCLILFMCKKHWTIELYLQIFLMRCLFVMQIITQWHLTQQWAFGFLTWMTILLNWPHHMKRLYVRMPSQIRYVVWSMNPLLLMFCLFVFCKCIRHMKQFIFSTLLKSLKYCNGNYYYK